MTTRSSWVSTMRGAWTALATPMKDGGVDEEALRALVDRQVAGGITGLIPCGTTGESATMSPAEQARVVRIVVEQNAKRAPVFAGAGTLSTAVSTDLARAAREAGADGLLLVTPYYNKPTQAGLIAHYRAILRDVPMPAILYNVPSRTMCDLQADTVAQLAEIPEVVAVKEASGNVLRTQEILERTGDRLSVLSGDDPLTLGLLACGARGVISVTSNLLPGLVEEVVRRFEKGDVEGARRLHYRLLPLHRGLFVETSPGPLKAAMAARGWIRPEIRLPLVWPSQAVTDSVTALLDRVEKAGA